VKFIAQAGVLGDFYFSHKFGARMPGVDRGRAHN
jgi:hypothetical protein